MAKYHLAIFHLDHEPHSKNPTEFHQVLTGIRELSSNELRQWRRYVNNISTYIKNRNLFRSLTLNFQDFENACNYYLINYHETQSMNWEMMEQMSMNLGRLFLNILGLFRCFVDHTETSLKRRFGKNSKSVKKWEDAKSECYDRSFAYRFMYHIRNHAQHVDVPSLNFEISSGLDEPLNDRESLISNLHIMLQTQPLLKDKKIPQKLTSEIQQLGQGIDLMPVIKDGFYRVSQLDRTRQEIAIRSVRNGAQKIVGLRNEISPPEHAAMCILKMPDNEGDELSVVMEWFPERESQSILGQLIR